VEKARRRSRRSVSRLATRGPHDVVAVRNPERGREEGRLDCGEERLHERSVLLGGADVPAAVVLCEPTCDRGLVLVEAGVQGREGPAVGEPLMRLCTELPDVLVVQMVEDANPEYDVERSVDPGGKRIAHARHEERTAVSPARGRAANVLGARIEADVGNVFGK